MSGRVRLALAMWHGILAAYLTATSSLSLADLVGQRAAAGMGLVGAAALAGTSTVMAWMGWRTPPG